MGNKYDFLESLRNYAEKMGLPKNEDVENPFGRKSFWDGFSKEGRARNDEIAKRYQTHDDLIKKNVIPELKKCLSKEGECTK